MSRTVVGVTRRRPRAKSMVALVLVAMLAAVATGTAHAAGGRVRREPALVTITGSSASLVQDGDAQRLVVSGVSPKASFDGKTTAESDITTIAAVTLLDTASAPALLRGTSTDPETEGLVLSDVTYNSATATLEADASPMEGVTDLSMLKDTGTTSDTDGALPAGPVELVALDTDTRVAASGAPQPPQGKFSTSYSVPVKITYNTITRDGQPVSATVKAQFVPSESQCASGKDLSFRAGFGPLTPHETSFEVNTEFQCLFSYVVATYKITVSGTAGPRPIPTAEGTLTVSSVGPRTFVSGCPDPPGATFDCGVRDIIVKPRVFLDILSR